MNPTLTALAKMFGVFIPNSHPLQPDFIIYAPDELTLLAFVDALTDAGQEWELAPPWQSRAYSANGLHVCSALGVVGTFYAPINRPAAQNKR